MKVFLLALLSVTAMGLDCHYEESTGKFTVKTGAQSFIHSARSNFDHAKIICDEKAAALYDGDEWVVFSQATQSFTWTKAERDSDYATTKSSPTLLTLMDGMNFHVYDLATEKFFSAPTKYFRSYRLTAGKAGAALYDGYDFFVFDQASGQIRKEKTREKYYGARLDAAGSLIAFYNGDRWKIINLKSGKEEEAGTESSSKRAWQLISEQGALLYDGKSLIGYSESRGQLDRLNLSLEITPATVALLKTIDGKFHFVIPKKPHWIYDPMTSSFSRS